MRKRVRNKIADRMKDIDEMLVFIVTNGYLSELPLWRADMRKLKRRWPKIYRATFFGELGTFKPSETIQMYTSHGTH